jgi:hypothetical protein
MSTSSFPLLILRHHLCPNHRQPRGLQIQLRPDQLEGALPLEEEGAKQGIGDPAYKMSQQSTKANVSRRKQKSTTSEHKDAYLG